MSKLRLTVLGLVLTLICASLFVVAFAAEDQLCIPTGAIEIAPPDEVEAKKSPVEFPHSLHFAYNCQECHHAWDLSSDLAGCMTSGCHDLTKAPKKAEKISAVRYYKKAFHTKCIGCHKQIKKENKTLEKQAALSAKDLQLKSTGPTGCKECHPAE